MRDGIDGFVFQRFCGGLEINSSPGTKISGLNVSHVRDVGAAASAGQTVCFQTRRIIRGRAFILRRATRNLIVFLRQKKRFNWLVDYSYQIGGIEFQI